MDITNKNSNEARLYSLAPQPNALMQACVLRTKNGKLIVIDGGIDGPGKDEPAYMPSALRAIAGVAQEEYVEVEAWILSHAHKDHFGELRKTLLENAANTKFVVKNFYFDFPAFGTQEYPYDGDDFETLEGLKEAMNVYAEKRGLVFVGDSFYDSVNGALVNAKSIEDGSANMEIDCVRIEFLQTWNASNGADINDNSLVFRFWIDGKSVLFLNDAHHAAGDSLLKEYGANLKSDVVQMSHHGQRGVKKEVYDVVEANVRLWHTPLWVWNDTTNFEIGNTRSWVNGGVDFTESSERDIVTCLYEKYPKEITSVQAWKEVIDEMFISIEG